MIAHNEGSTPNEAGGPRLRIAAFRDERGDAWGVVRGNRLTDARQLPGAPADILGLLSAPDRDRWLAEAAAAAAVRSLAEVLLLAPISRPPSDVIALGLNYVEHVDETADATKQASLPKVPILFSKAAGSVVGPFDEIRVDRSVVQKVDWEVELALVIGRGGRDIRPEAALEHIFGYMVANDVSGRDLQFLDGGQWYRGKGLDTFCPTGPWIVTRDEVGDADSLHLELRVNGVVKQSAGTEQMIFDIPTTIASISAGRTLVAGDIILTGTPSGVGIGRTPQEFLVHGDVVEAEIEGIGLIRNRVHEVGRD
jgi:2-keto-4-pentenoate hydratase/2-oxohepta-3-ene-1,7-dioic acid hydratase in catechol pathway